MLVVSQLLEVDTTGAGRCVSVEEMLGRIQRLALQERRRLKGVCVCVVFIALLIAWESIKDARNYFEQ